MPHQCTNCGKVFPDGSKEMLSGCPNCGGNKFQFRPSGNFDDAVDESDVEDDTPSDASAQDDTATARDASPRVDTATARASSSRRESADDAAGDQSARRDQSATDTSDAEPTRSVSAPAADVDVDDREDSAQADARSDVVSPDELAAASADASTAEAPTAVDSVAATSDDDDERPGLDELREELNSQFESIKIISPGQYELNLMELFDRQEYIISLQEDGCYVIEVPDAWGGREA